MESGGKGAEGWANGAGFWAEEANLGVGLEKGRQTQRVERVLRLKGCREECFEEDAGILD